jgi:hypothetical protein
METLERLVPVLQRELVALVLTTHENEGPVEDDLQRLLRLEVLLQVLRARDYDDVDLVVPRLWHRHLRAGCLLSPSQDATQKALSKAARRAWYDDGRVTEGDVIRLHDRLTGFDDNKPDRPYCVVRVVGDPWSEVYAVPRTSEPVRGGVRTPANVLPGLNKEGWFLFRGYRLERADVQGAEHIGKLSADVTAQVQEQANLAEFDID